MATVRTPSIGTATAKWEQARKAQARLDSAAARRLVGETIDLHLAARGIGPGAALRGRAARVETHPNETRKTA